MFEFRVCSTEGDLIAVDFAFQVSYILLQSCYAILVASHLPSQILDVLIHFEVGAVLVFFCALGFFCQSLCGEFQFVD